MANTFSLWQLLNSKKITVPLIQRDYAQGRRGKEYIRSAFLKDIESHLCQGSGLTLDFVYGNIENDSFQPLDGQQRLTTLWLVHWYIAYKSKRLNKVRDILKRFSYETRITSRLFCHELCDKMADVSQPDNVRLSHLIQEQPWFFSDWMQDPTVNSMLRAISGESGARAEDNIESIFKDDRLDDYWQKLTESSLITFELMIIGTEKLPISDDLYIKMNARGKKLTDFENLKADWVSFIQNDNAFSNDNEEISSMLPSQYYPAQIDNYWTDVFWNNSRDENGNIDDAFFMFLNRFVLNQICLDSNFSPSHYDTKEPDKATELQQKFHKLYGTGLGGKRNSNDDSIIEYEGFGVYRDYLTLENHKRLDKIFSELTNNINKITDISLSDSDGEDEGASEIFTFLPCRAEGRLKATRQKERIYFHALCLFLENPNWEQFEVWLRILRNLVENAGVDTVESMITCLRFIDKLGCFLRENNWKIYEFLPYYTPEDISTASRLGVQWQEEKEKAKKICEDPSLEAKIKEAESYCFFNGTIKFLFTDSKGNVDWTNFNTKFENAKLRFNETNKVPVTTVKLFLSMFETFESLGADSYYFTTIGYHARYNCWKTTILCNQQLSSQVHSFLIAPSPDSCARGAYKNFIDSGAIDEICSKGDSYKYRYHLSRSWAIHRDYSSTDGIYVYNGRLDKNRIIINLAENGVLTLSEKNKSFDEYLWGTEVMFSYNGKEYCWTVDWSGRDIIQQINSHNSPLIWCDSSEEGLLTLLNSN